MAAKGKPAVAGSTRERTRTAPQTRPAASAPAQAAPSAPQQEQLSPTPQAASPARRAPQARKQAAAAPSSKSRELSKARRQALAQSGRRADNKTDRVRADTIKKEAEAKAKIPARGDCGCGCKGAGDCQGRKEQPAAQTAAPRLSDTSRSGDSRERRASKLARARRAQGANKPAGRLVAQAKRAAQANRGKAAADSSSSAAGLARQANPRLSSRELAQRVREQRSKQGASGVRKTPCASRQRAERRQGAADQTWKVGASETARGQTVTGTRADRTPTMTGDDGDLCRNVTGTEYLGAEIFRDFCQSEAPKGPDKVGKSSTTKGNTVTGNEVGRSPSVTGDEPGSCAAVTGAQYLSAEHLSKFCGADPKANAARQQPMAAVAKGREVQVTGDEKGAGVTPTGARYTDAQSIRNGRIERDAPVAAPKPAQREPKLSETLAGTRITGQRVGRSSRVTGDEPGTCQNVTGDQYVEASQYRSFCAEEPKPEAPKVGQSATLGRQRVSGTMTGRSARVTGDEPGTCQSVTGTPYAGLDQVEAFCAPQARTRIEARTPQRRATPGPRMTGIQPGISGPLTGASKGACETPTGTPYVGEDDYAEACEPSLSAAPGDSDFPQPLEISAPVVAAPAAAAPAKPAVTGTRYGLGGGHVTGPFDMATGKVTGTEQARSNAQAEIVAATPKPESAAERRSRVTGEGQTAGHKITGDDWDRGDRVTGTEGSSAKRRNPSRNGPMSAMPTVERKRNEEVPEPVSKITGASGNTDRGALITYSGGARG
jgi:hypothetical protein